MSVANAKATTVLPQLSFYVSAILFVLLSSSLLFVFTTETPSVFMKYFCGVLLMIYPFVFLATLITSIVYFKSKVSKYAILISLIGLSFFLYTCYLTYEFRALQEKWQMING